MVATWSDSHVSSLNEGSNINIKANLCLMAKEDEVCDDDLDDYDDIKHEMIVCLMILKNSWKNVKLIEKLLPL